MTWHLKYGNDSGVRLGLVVSVVRGRGWHWKIGRLEEGCWAAVEAALMVVRLRILVMGGIGGGINRWRREGLGERDIGRRGRRRIERVGRGEGGDGRRKRRRRGREAVISCKREIEGSHRNLRLSPTNTHAWIIRWLWRRPEVGESPDQAWVHGGGLRKRGASAEVVGSQQGVAVVVGRREGGGNGGNVVKAGRGLEEKHVQYNKKTPCMALVYM